MKKQEGAIKFEKLKVDEMTEEFFSDSAMVGIVCALPAYHLCWLINKEYDMSFRCVPEMTLEFRNGDGISHFAVYQYMVPGDNHEYLLYKVKNDSTFLLPRQKGSWLNNIDYLFLLKTANPEKDAGEFAAQLKNLEGISLSRPVESDLLRHIENLLV